MMQTEAFLVLLEKKPDTYKEALLFICNFTPMERWDYMVGVPAKGVYEIILNSECDEETGKKYKSVKETCDGYEYSLKIHLKPLEAYILKFPK